MALEYLPDIFDPWTDEMLDKLTLREAIFTHWQMERQMKLLQKRVAKDPSYQEWSKKKFGVVVHPAAPIK